MCDSPFFFRVFFFNVNYLPSYFSGTSYVEDLKTQLGHTSFTRTSSDQWIEVLELYDHQTLVQRSNFPKTQGHRPLTHWRSLETRWSKTKTAMFDSLINAGVVSLVAIKVVWYPKFLTVILNKIQAGDKSRIAYPGDFAQDPAYHQAPASSTAHRHSIPVGSHSQSFS